MAENRKVAPMTSLAPSAIVIAAKATGLRPDQIERAVNAYREAVDELEGDEPQWIALSHVCGQRMSFAQYRAEGTAIFKQIDSSLVRGGWRTSTLFIYTGRPYQTFAEAREIELLATSRPSPELVKERT